MSSKKTIVTHNGSFHTDDVFGVATLLLHFGEEHCTIVRTRDETLIATADIVLDVGGEYDVSRDRFDHHQIGGAGVRKNGIPYAAFGLIWKKYGALLASSAAVSQHIDQIFVQPIDAQDSGVNLSTPLRSDIRSVDVEYFTSLFRPISSESQSYDDAFVSATRWAGDILRRLIVVAIDEYALLAIIEDLYRAAPDKRFVVMDERHYFSRQLTVAGLTIHPEPLYAALYRHDVDSWQVVAVNEAPGTFRVRKPFPESWAGKRDAELVAVTGVPDAIFCHNGRFMIAVKSKEGALKLAELALKATG